MSSLLSQIPDPLECPLRDEYSGMNWMGILIAQDVMSRKQEGRSAV